MPRYRLLQANRPDEVTIQRAWRHLIGPGALLDEPSEMRLAPHDAPLFLSAIQARPPRSGLQDATTERIHGSGCGLTSIAAQAGAIGEAIERYSATRRLDDEVVRASYRELGPQGIAPQRFALYTNAQYADPRCHFQPFTETTVLDWIEGWSWTHQRPQYIPTCFVYLEPCAGEAPCIFHSVSTGLACGPTDEVAMLSGVYEVIERDAIMIAWLNGLELPRLRPPDHDPVLDELYRRLQDKQMQATVLDATTDIGVPVRIALLENRAGSTSECAVGMAAHSDPIDAHQKALIEACHTLNWLHQLKHQYQGALADVHSRPLATFKDHVLRYGFEAAKRELDIWRCGPWRDERPAPSPTPVTPRRLFDRLVRRLAQIGLEVLTVDIKRPDVAEAGFRVCRVVVPGMQPLTPGDMPCLGGVRLWCAPLSIACRARYQPGVWNPHSHPFP